MSRLVGRCACGVALELVAEDQEVHLECAGLRRCRSCDLVKSLDQFQPQRRRCRDCRRVEHTDYVRRCTAEDPAYAEAHRASARRWAKTAYRNRPGHADAMKAAKRQRYQADPTHSKRSGRGWRANHGRAA